MLKIPQIKRDHNFDQRKNIVRKTYSNVKLKKGDELGIFNMGSTAIIAFEASKVEWRNNLETQQIVQMGQTLGEAIN